MASHRLDALDAVRGLAIVGVLAIHTVGATYSRSHPSTFTRVVQDVIGPLLLLAVPAFFMLSGFVLARRPRTGESTTGFMSRRLRRVVIPLLVWGLVALAVTTARGAASPSSAADWAAVLLLGHRALPLYFLVVAAQLAVVAAVLPREGRARDLACVGLVVVQLVATGVLVAVVGPTSPNAVTAARTADYIGVFWVGYFGIGVLAGRRPAAVLQAGRRVRIGVLVALVAVAAAAALPFDRGWILSGYHSPTQLPYAVLATLAATWWAAGAVRPGMRARFARLGRRSFAIYLGQVVVLPYLGAAVAAHTLSGPPWAVLLVWAGVVAVGLVACDLVTRIVRVLPLGTVALGEA